MKQTRGLFYNPFKNASSAYVTKSASDSGRLGDSPIKLLWTVNRLGTTGFESNAYCVSRSAVGSSNPSTGGAKNKTGGFNYFRLRSPHKTRSRGTHFSARKPLNTSEFTAPGCNINERTVNLEISFYIRYPAPLLLLPPPLYIETRKYKI